MVVLRFNEKTACEIDYIKKTFSQKLLAANDWNVLPRIILIFFTVYDNGM